MVQEAGPDGPGLQQLAAKLDKPAQDIEQAARLLQVQGLICTVPGYADWAFVAAAHSASFFTDAEGQYRGPFLPPPEPDSAAAGARAEPIAGGSKPQRGAHLLAPWLDHKGGVNRPLWNSLVTRLVSLVTNLPGTKPLFP